MKTTTLAHKRPAVRDTADHWPSPRDVDEAWDGWRANCGPASLAAVLGANLADVRPFFPHFPGRSRTSLRDMQNILENAEIAYQLVDDLPDVGLALLQFTGPWMHARHAAPALKHTHWVGVKSGWFYEVNWSMWMPERLWAIAVLEDFRWANPKIEGWKIRKSVDLGVHGAR